MLKKKSLPGMLVMILIFGMTVIGCDNGTTNTNGTQGVNSNKYLIISNITRQQVDASDSSYAIGIYEPGTTLAEALAWQKIVAGSEWSEIIISGSDPYFVVTAPLFSFPFNYDGKRWTGSGTYDVFVKMNVHNEGFVLRNVAITSETTYIDAKDPNIEEL